MVQKLQVSYYLTLLNKHVPYANFDDSGTSVYVALVLPIIW